MQMSFYLLLCWHNARQLSYKYISSLGLDGEYRKKHGKLRAGIRIQKKALIGAQKIKSKQKCFQLPNRPPLQVKVRKINSAKKRAIVDKRRLPRFQDSSSSLCARSMARHVPEVHCLHDYESKGGCVVTLQAREGTVILRDQLTTWSFTLLRCTVTTWYTVKINTLWDIVQ